MTQPGSLRDSAESFSKIAATSDSRPIFAIQVTANTTIRRSVSFHAETQVAASPRRAKPRLCKIVLTTCQTQFLYKVRDQDRLLAIGARGNHSHPGSSFFLDKGQIIAGGLG